METYAFYLFKSAVWLTGFSLIFFLFLRNERYFRLNRIYLISGILASLIFPLITLHYTVEFPLVPTTQEFMPQVQGVVQKTQANPMQNLLLYIYLFGISYLIFRLIKQTSSVLMTIRKSEKCSIHSVKLIRTDRYPASFSFFSFVFVNPSITDTEVNEIVNHESEHISQKHWIDLLLYEALCIVQWMNPVVWLYGRMIRQNHEYLADERALQRSANPAIYHAALLNQMFGGPVIQLANSFNYSLNKKRFNMMKQTISSPVRKLRLLLILPFIAGVLYAFATPEYKFVQAENATVIQDGKTITGQVLSEDGTPLKSANIVISGKTIGTITDASGKFKLEVTDDSPIVVSYVGCESLKVVPDFSNEMRLVLKKKTFELNFDKLSAEKKETASNKLPKASLILINGIESSKAEMDKLNQGDIQSVNILKGETAVKQYGDRGKDGAIEITLKESKQPLFIVDGKERESVNFKNLPPDSIASVSVLKNESATKLYGEKGKNGVVLITTKKKSSADKSESRDIKVTGYSSNQKEVSADRKSSGIQIRGNGVIGPKGKPLVVVDGVISPNQDIHDVSPDSIASVFVWKGDSATAKYGDKGKDGVIEIHTKAKTPMVMVEDLPQFPGGPNALNFFIQSSVKYPEDALKNVIQGKVFVSFTVEKDGSISDVKVTRSVSPSLNEEAVRVIKSMPKWKPAMQNSEPVSVSYTVPVNFKLPGIK